MYQRLIDEGFADLMQAYDAGYGEEIDPARGGSPPPPPNRGISGNVIQANKWAELRRRFRQWGVDPGTLRGEQAQVVPAQRPRTTTALRTRRRTVQRLSTASNQPDLQGIDPRTGRRFNVEVERRPQRREDQDRILREFRQVIANDPEARSVLQILDPQTGRTLEKHVYNPLTRRTTTMRNEELRRRDILDLDDW